ncbi:hypothetical protein PSYAE_25575, partial [Pseudomonas amygdali pv. aesculi str. 0893_23]
MTVGRLRPNEGYIFVDYSILGHRFRGHNDEVAEKGGFARLSEI